MLQMMLPLFYPAAVLVNVGADLLLAAAKPRWLMGLGWRPQRDFSLKALRDTYLPPALFFINMYCHTPRTGRLVRVRVGVPISRQPSTRLYTAVVVHLTPNDARRYFYTGISRSFEMLQCKPVDPDDAAAGSFLMADPVTRCWEGDHSTHAALAAVGVLVYCVLLPLAFAYVLLVLIPKKGLQNKARTPH